MPLLFADPPSADVDAMYRIVPEGLNASAAGAVGPEGMAKPPIGLPPPLPNRVMFELVKFDTKRSPAVQAVPLVCGAKAIPSGAKAPWPAPTNGWNAVPS